MHTKVDYTKSSAPNFDAVNDIMEWLGDKYATVAPEMAKVTDTDAFMFYCGLAGIQGFPVRAWYDHFHGEGAFAKAFKL